VSTGGFPHRPIPTRTACPRRSSPVARRRLGALLSPGLLAPLSWKTNTGDPYPYWAAEGLSGEAHEAWVVALYPPVRRHHATLLSTDVRYWLGNEAPTESLYLDVVS